MKAAIGRFLPSHWFGEAAITVTRGRPLAPNDGECVGSSVAQPPLSQDARTARFLLALFERHRSESTGSW